MSEACEHVWKVFESTRGTNPPIVTGRKTWCEKCGVRKPGDVSEAEQELEDKWEGWNYLTTRNGDYR